MALAQGGIVGALSGRLGDVVYAHSRDGLVVRQFTQPTDPGTARQVLMRDALQSANTEWASLSLSDRSVWMNYGNVVKVANRFGVRRLITGREHFIGWFLAVTGATDAEPDVMTTPRLLTTPATPLGNSVDVAITEAGQAFFNPASKTLDPWPEPPNVDLFVGYLSPPLPLTRNFWKQSFPAHTSNTYVNDSIKIVQTWGLTSFGWDPAGGERAFWKLRFIRNDGRLSPWVYGFTLTEPQ